MFSLGSRKKTKVKTAKGRKLSSTRWLQRHLNDPYVVKAQIDQYRSRAAYKLLEIDEKYKLLRKDSVVVDLGAAPGSWSQIVIEKKASKVIAVDLLDMNLIEGVDVIKGDFTSDQIINDIVSLLGDKKIDLLLSDMSPNISGNKNVDHLKMINLAEMVMEFARTYIRSGGNIVIKIFQGSDLEPFVKYVQEIFATKVRYFKPDSSRKESSEMYLIIPNIRLK
ncbi:MAG: RlmE family RNA methyltransferase [Rickettsiales bacterium]|nr:RlmE family RNA methyltransferase [Rickettsiales bacterium]